MDDNVVYYVVRPKLILMISLDQHFSYIKINYLSVFCGNKIKEEYIIDHYRLTLPHVYSVQMYVIIVKFI